ncbi:MAG: hypothetical protein MUC48_15430 [Leptolyngbya sp. Prado105]|nr:hypothetical protein [Leptolyngbya sp. Prado105]
MWLATRPQGSVAFGQLTVPCPTDAAELFIAGRTVSVPPTSGASRTMRGWY